MYHSQWIMSHLVHANGVFTAEQGPFYLLSLIALVVAGTYTQRLYSLLTDTRALSFLVYPVFLLSVIFTYAVRPEANYSYPYDFVSLAFFTAGLYYIYSRKFLGIVLVILIGTFNRETTLFLIGIYVLDASFQRNAPLRSRFLPASIPWLRLVMLSTIWVAIRVSLAHTFRHNDASEDFLRAVDNLHELKPRLLPALVNVCGFVMPCVVVSSRLLYPRRFASYLLILIPWFGIMFCSGILVETRIYGELCSYSAIAAVLIMERAASYSILAKMQNAQQLLDSTG